MHTHNQELSEMIQATPILQTRLDGPHGNCPENELLPGDLTAEASVEACLAESDGEMGESDGAMDESAELCSRIRTQVEQIAQYLRAQCHDLDCREGRFHAQLSQLDEEARQARLWFQERHEELHVEQARFAEQQAVAGHQSEELNRQAVQLDEREQELSARADLLGDIIAQVRHQREVLRHQLQSIVQEREALGAESARRFEEIAQREAASEEIIRLLEQGVQQRQAAGEARQAEQEEKNIALHAHWLRQVTALQAESGQLEERRGELESAAELIGSERESLAAMHTSLEQAKAEHHQQISLERDELVQNRTAAEAELQEQRTALDARDAELTQRQQLLFAFQAQLRKAQQETLEVRLATEEIWSRLSGTVPPAVLTRSMAEIRSRLADIYHLAEADLQSERKSLESLRAQLQQQVDKLAAQRREVQAWQERRQEELDAQAAELAASRRELEVQLAHQREQQSRWHQSEQHYRAEIQRLLLSRSVLSFPSTP